MEVWIYFSFLNFGQVRRVARSGKGARKIKKRKYLKMVWAVLALSFLLGYGCASLSKAGVKFEPYPKIEDNYNRPQY